MPRLGDHYRRAWGDCAPSIAQPLAPISACWDGEDIFVSYRWTDAENFAATVRRGVWMERELPRAEYGSLHRVRGKVEKVTFSHNRLWFVGNGVSDDSGPVFFSVVPLTDLQYLEGGDWGIRLRAKHKAAGGRLEIDYSVYDLFWGGESAAEHALLEGAWSQENRKGKKSPFERGNFQEKYGVHVNSLGTYREVLLRREVRFDLIPTGEKTALCVSAKGTTVTFREVFIGDARNVEDGKYGKPLPESKPRTVKVPFDGDFWAYKVDDVFYLLTRTGKLYSVRDNAKGELEAATVWDVKDRPLIGAIQDARRKSGFVFGTDADPKRGGRFVFEMAPVADPAFYVTEAKSGDGFRETQDCVRAIKKHLKQDHLPPVVAPAPRPKP